MRSHAALFAASVVVGASALAACADDAPLASAPFVPSGSLDASVDVVVADAGPSRDAADPDGEAGAPSWVWQLPPGFPEPIVPADNPMTAEKVALGRHLFYDPRLSRNETQSCATCHEQKRAFTEPRSTSLGSTGQAHPRNAMALANVAYAATLTWANPVLRGLEDQAIVPIFGADPIELGWNGREVELVARLRAVPKYEALFAAAFGDAPDAVSVASIVRALASFQRTLLSGRAPYDRFIHDKDEGAISESAKRGLLLFNSERLECFHCHSGFALQDSVKYVGKPFVEMPFHNTGLYNVDGKGAYPAPNVGLVEFTNDPRHMGRFRVASLRNVAVTAPYMHDGSAATLDDVLDHYAAAGRTIMGGPNAGVGSDSPLRSGFLVGFSLTLEERGDVKAFLESLTDAEFLVDPRFSDPWIGP